MWLKSSFFILLCGFMPINAVTNDTLKMIISFVTFEDRSISVLAPNLCWTSYQLNTLARNLSASGINVACSLQPNRPHYHLHNVLIIADLSCPGSNEFLLKAESPDCPSGKKISVLQKTYKAVGCVYYHCTKHCRGLRRLQNPDTRVCEASNDGYFKSPYRWLLLEEDADLVILNKIVMLVNSDVVVARRRGTEVHFVEVYKIAEDSEVIYTTRSIWRPIYPKIDNEINTINTKTKSDNNTSITPKETANKEIILTRTKYGVIEDYREMKVLLVRRKDLRGHTLTLVNVITDSNETRNHMDDRLQLHQDSITKMSYMAVKICFEMLNASERLVFTHTWGYRDKYGNWQGIVDHLIKKKADLGTLTIFTQERMEIIDYIAMVGTTSVRFVFREPPLSYISNIFALPFTSSVWLACFVCVLGCAVFLYITSKWEATMGMHPLQLDGSWADVLILIIGAVLQQGCTLEPRHAAGRCVTLLLFVALTILYAAYSANIVVLLRAPSSSVRSLTDLLNSPLQLGASDFEYNRYFFKKLNEPIRKAIYDKKIAPKGKSPNFYSMKEGIDKIRKGLFAFHMELNPGYRLIQETYQEDEKCDLVEIDYINEIDPWVPGQKNSPFKDLFKINFIKIRETGLQQCIHNRLIIPKPKCSGVVSTFSSVGITDMYPGMLATLYGMLLAPAVLLLEIAYKRLLMARKKRKLMRNNDFY